MIAVLTQNSGKLASHSEIAASMLPSMPMAEPVMKPRRRPTRAIHSEAGIVAAADPSTYVVAPTLAKALLLTSP